MTASCNNSPPSNSRYLIFASTNRNKFFEVRTAMGHSGIPLYSLSDFPPLPDAPETGATFAENAAQKAEYYYSHFKQIVMAEDSGLVIPALGGFPGIHSARVAADDPSRIAAVLERLRALADGGSTLPDSPQRSAYYVCRIAVLSEKGMLTSEGRVDGTLTEAPEGAQGFGYDPIFRPEGLSRTFGMMSIREKSQYSHRARAVHAILPELLQLFRTLP